MFTFFLFFQRGTMSPLSPDPDSATSDPEMMTFPVKQREPKTVILKKTKFNSKENVIIFVHMTRA